ncbi:hypothetical protein LX36DRAFT_694070 [Colletotrichum falcatum]|nr:hypothetical protein LX36DRAFT_694070 [Colletotrichum falcatum]
MAQEAPDAMAIAVRPSVDVKAEPGPAVPGNLVVYGEDGDLTIRVGPGLDAFRVDSKTLSRSSVVFKKMLFGGFAESRPSDGSDWVVDLPDDDSYAMEVLFRIAHGAFAMYDATHLLRPWAGAWVRSPAVREQTEEPELLCVAWGLGDFDLFALMLDKMINECLVDAGGNVVYGRRRTQQEGHSVGPSGILAPSEFVFNTLVHLVPPDIEDIILNSRRKLVRAELRAYVDLYADCKKGQRCFSQTAGSVTSWKCDSAVLGSLIKSLGCCDQKIKKSLAEGKEKAARFITELVAVRDAYNGYLESQARKTGL